MFNDYTIKNIPVGDYSVTGDITKTIFTAENTVYYFGAGRYKVQEIVMPSNSVLYIAPGAYIEVTGELGTINMLVTDLLPEGKKGDLDLYVDAFPLIAPMPASAIPAPHLPWVMSTWMPTGTAA